MSDSSIWQRPANRPLIFGHRGVRGPLPENTMAAFERAAKEGADGVELDVRLCRTGEIVVAHDRELTRVTAGADNRLVDALDFGELHRLRLGGEPMPLLAEVLDFAAPRGFRVNVEMKRDVPDRLSLVYALSKAAKEFADTVMVSSFDPFMLWALKSLVPGLRTGLLFEREQLYYHPWTAGWVLGFSAFHPESTLIDENTVRHAAEHQRSLAAWTVNDVSEAKRLNALGVAAIITDKPGETVAAFSQ